MRWDGIGEGRGGKPSGLTREEEGSFDFPEGPRGGADVVRVSSKPCSLAVDLCRPSFLPSLFYCFWVLDDYNHNSEIRRKVERNVAQGISICVFSFSFPKLRTLRRRDVEAPKPSSRSRTHPSWSWQS